MIFVDFFFYNTDFWLQLIFFDRLYLLYSVVGRPGTKSSKCNLKKFMYNQAFNLYKCSCELLYIFFAQQTQLKTVNFSLNFTHYMFYFTYLVALTWPSTRRSYHRNSYRGTYWKIIKSELKVGNMKKVYWKWEKNI